MPAFTLKYLSDSDEVIREEIVFMRGLRAAKQSGSVMSPSCAVGVDIVDLCGRVLASKRKGKWEEKNKEKLTERV